MLTRRDFLKISSIGAAALALSACGNDSTASGTESSSAEAASNAKFGIVLVGDENEGYTAAHINGVKAAMEALNISEDQIIWKYNIPEDETCADTCTDLAEEGCAAIFTNSYSHQSYCQQVASNYPDIQFVSMTGDTAKKSGLENFSNAFNYTFESRYVSGIVAGMKVKELVESNALSDENYSDGKVKIGYVGAYPYAEVVSGFTGFFLGIQSIYPDVTMEVQYTNSWFDLTAENNTAKQLIADGCVIIGQHADSTGAPSAVQEELDAGKVCYSVGYNIDMLSVAPTAALTSSSNNWGVYYTYAFQQVLNGEKIATDWAAGYNEDAVCITALGESCAEGTAEAVAAAESAIKDGTLHVFDVSTFTLSGDSTEYQIDADGHMTSAFCFDADGDWINESEEAVSDGYYHESEFISAPSFKWIVDGIVALN